METEKRKKAGAMFGKLKTAYAYTSSAFLDPRKDPFENLADARELVADLARLDGLEISQALIETDLTNAKMLEVEIYVKFYDVDKRL